MPNSYASESGKRRAVRAMVSTVADYADRKISHDLRYGYEDTRRALVQLRSLVDDALVTLDAEVRDAR